MRGDSYGSHVAAFPSALPATALAAILLAAAPAVGHAAATLRGTVQEAETARPLGGAIVLLPDLERGTTTDAEGRYEFALVPAGPHHLVVRRIGFEPRTLHALVPREGSLEIHVALQPRPVPLASLDVRAPLPVRGVEPGDSTRRLDREWSIASVRNHPLLTETDVFQALEGGDVVLRPETPSGMHVRGSANDHLAYLIDGVPVLSPYHTAGLSSAWNPEVVSRFRLRSGDALPGEPHALAGALEALTRTPGRRLRGQGSVSAAQARATLDGPLGRGDAGYLLSARTGFAGLLGRKRESTHLRGDTGDGLAKVEAPAFGGRLRLLGYGSINEIDAAAAVPSESSMIVDPRRNVFDWRSRSFGAEWGRSWSTAGARIRAWRATLDADAAWQALAGPVRLVSDRREWGVAAEVERRTATGALHGGARYEVATTAYGVRADSAFALDWSLDARTPVATFYGGYEGRAGPRVVWGGGISATAAAGDGVASPRASIRWRVSERLTVAGGYARTNQFLQSLRNPESVVGTVFPVELSVGARARGIPVAYSDQGVIAAEFRPAPGVRLSLQGFVRDAGRLVLVAPRSTEPFAIGDFTVGSGTARGLSLEAGIAGARYGVFAAYAVQRVRLSYGDSSYVPEHGAEHTLHAGIVAFPASTLSVRLGGAALWGRRTTTALGDFEWEACNLLDRGCEFGGSPHYVDPLGATALPAYYRVDFGVRKHWHVGVGGRDVSIALFGAYTNLLGRKNVLTYARDPASGETRTVVMRPRAPLVAGLEWEF